MQTITIPLKPNIVTMLRDFMGDGRFDKNQQLTITRDGAKVAVKVTERE